MDGHRQACGHCRTMSEARGVRLVLGFSPGSLSDHIARILRDALAEQLGAPVTIELKPGHNGIPAAREVVESQARRRNAFHGDAGHARDRAVPGAASGVRSAAGFHLPVAGVAFADAARVSSCARCQFSRRADRARAFCRTYLCDVGARRRAAPRSRIVPEGWRASRCATCATIKPRCCIRISRRARYL